MLSHGMLIVHSKCHPGQRIDIMIWALNIMHSKQASIDLASVVITDRHVEPGPATPTVWVICRIQPACSSVIYPESS